jgi:hypothetical protein
MVSSRMRAAGIEPATKSLKGSCSTTELRPQATTLVYPLNREASKPSPLSPIQCGRCLRPVVLFVSLKIGQDSHLAQGVEQGGQVFAAYGVAVWPNLPDKPAAHPLVLD